MLAVSPAPCEQAFRSLSEGRPWCSLPFLLTTSCDCTILETVLQGITVTGSIIGTRVELAETFQLHVQGRTKVVPETRQLEQVNESFDRSKKELSTPGWCSTFGEARELGDSVRSSPGATGFDITEASTMRAEREEGLAVEAEARREADVPAARHRPPYGLSATGQVSEVPASGSRGSTCLAAQAGASPSKCWPTCCRRLHFVQTSQVHPARCKGSFQSCSFWLRWVEGLGSTVDSELSGKLNKGNVIGHLCGHCIRAPAHLGDARGAFQKL